MPSWYMFVRANNSSGDDDFENAEHMARVLTPIEFDFAFLEDRAAVVNDWAESRWGLPIGPWVRVWSVGWVCEEGKESEYWIPHIMDIWAEKFRDA